MTGGTRHHQIGRGGKRGLPTSKPNGGHRIASKEKARRPGMDGGLLCLCQPYWQQPGCGTDPAEQRITQEIRAARHAGKTLEAIANDLTVRIRNRSTKAARTCRVATKTGRHGAESITPYFQDGKQHLLIVSLKRAA